MLRSSVDWATVKHATTALPSIATARGTGSGPLNWGPWGWERDDFRVQFKDCIWKVCWAVSYTGHKKLSFSKRRPMTCLCFLTDEMGSTRQTFLQWDNLAEASSSVSTLSRLCAKSTVSLFVVDVACDQYNDQRFRRSNRRQSMSFQYISNLHFIYFSNKMDRILEAESCSFSRIALGLYQRSTFLRNFHYGTGNVSPNNTDF